MAFKQCFVRLSNDSLSVGATADAILGPLPHAPAAHPAKGRGKVLCQDGRGSMLLLSYYFGSLVSLNLRILCDQSQE